MAVRTLYYSIRRKNRKLNEGNGSGVVERGPIIQEESRVELTGLGDRLDLQDER